MVHNQMNNAAETIVKRWIDSLHNTIVSDSADLQKRHSACITMADIVNFTQSDETFTSEFRDHIRHTYLQAIRSNSNDTFQEAAILISRMLLDINAWENRYSRKYDVLSITPLIKGHLEMLYETLLDRRLPICDRGAKR